MSLSHGDPAPSTELMPNTKVRGESCVKLGPAWCETARGASLAAARRGPVLQELNERRACTPWHGGLDRPVRDGSPLALDETRERHRILDGHPIPSHRGGGHGTDRRDPGMSPIVGHAQESIDAPGGRGS